MTDSVQLGLWFLLAMVVAVFLVSGIVYARTRRDEESGDLEHWDHEPTEGMK